MLLRTLVVLLPFGAVLMHSFTYGSGVSTEKEKATEQFGEDST